MKTFTELEEINCFVFDKMENKQYNAELKFACGFVYEVHIKENGAAYAFESMKELLNHFDICTNKIQTSDFKGLKKLIIKIFKLNE